MSWGHRCMKPILEKEIRGAQKVMDLVVILSLLLNMLFTSDLLDYMNVKNL